VHPSGAAARGVAVVDGGSATLRNVTLDGADTSGASRGVITLGGSATVAVRGSIVRGFAAAFERAAVTGAFTVGTTDFEFGGAIGAVDSTPGGNLDADPQFVDRIAGDYRLRRTSALIDAGAADAPAGNESPLDRRGVARVLDGSGDGAAQRDVGAYEYRRPAALLSLATPANTGATVPFTAFDSTYPDGQIARYLWDLDGNGSFETDTGATPRAERVYPDPVRITVRLRVVGSDGAFDDAERPFAALDRTAPRIISAGLVPATFARGPFSTPLTSARIEPITTPRSRSRFTAARGTSFRFSLSERATLRIGLELVTIGRRSGRSCLPATQARRRLPRCTRYSIVGLLSRYNRLVGPGAVAFSGRLRGRALPLGRYRATYTASDASGNRSSPRRLFFRIVLR